MKENIYEEIIKYFKELQEYNYKIDEDIRNNSDPYDVSRATVIEIEEYYDFDIKMLEHSIEENFKKLYNYSLKNDYYYFDCPAKVYINQFEKRREEFFKTNIDAQEHEFLLDEIEYFSSPKKNRVIGVNPVFNYDKYIIVSKKYKFSLQRKIDFLSEKLNAIGYKINFSQPDPIYDSFYNTETILEGQYNLEPLEENAVNLQTTEFKSLSNLTLNTDLSVPQLSLLFKMINDLKPTIFKTDSNADLFRFISANFKTKKSPEIGISTKKLRNEFNAPDLKAIEFWEKHLHTMLAQLRNLK